MASGVAEVALIAAIPRLASGSATNFGLTRMSPSERTRAASSVVGSHTFSRMESLSKVIISLPSVTPLSSKCLMNLSMTSCPRSLPCGASQPTMSRVARRSSEIFPASPSPNAWLSVWASVREKGLVNSSLMTSTAPPRTRLPPRMVPPTTPDDSSATSRWSRGLRRLASLSIWNDTARSCCRLALPSTGSFTSSGASNCERIAGSSTGSNVGAVSPNCARISGSSTSSSFAMTRRFYLTTANPTTDHSTIR